MVAARSLLETISDHLASDELRLPVYSPVAAELQRIAANDDCSSAQIEEVLLRDMALASQVLRMANSSFYAGLSKAATVNAAIVRLGLNQVVSLAVLCAQREQFHSSDPLIAAHTGKLWRHSVACAFGARWLAHRCGYAEMAAEAFMAGLFHDIGELLLLKIIEQIRSATDPQHVPEALMMEVVEALHTEQGGRLIEAWNLPESYALVARKHHAPEVESAGVLGLVVRMADRACQKLGLDLNCPTSIVLSACPEAVLLGMTEIALAELEIFLEDEAGPLAG